MDNYGSGPRPDDSAEKLPGADVAAQGVRTPAGNSLAPNPQVADSATVGPGASLGPPPADTSEPPHLAGPLAIYSALRVGLIVALTAVLAIFMPLIVALMFAIVVQLPLAWILFRGPREKVTEAMAQRSATRRAERQRLQSALSGDEPLP